MSSGLETKSKSKNKMTAIAVIAIIVLAAVGVVAWQLSIKKSATKQTTQTASIQVNGTVENWSIVVNGTMAPVNMDMQAYLTELSHSAVNFTCQAGYVWTGVPLYQIVSYSVENGGSSNASLANGYSVKVIGGDGSYAVFTGSEVNSNPDSLIVASERNGAVLPSSYWPLTLVGGSTMSVLVENIVQIQIIPNYS
ncbi:MAG TPA: hypothetical protein VED00_03065 [archaeon]|nr:hypothetical protein [archaeon]